MIIAIVLTGIVAGIVAVFITKPITAYLDSARRAEMTDAADTAVRRISRDIRAALPNSLRQPGGASANQCIEFLPIVGGGRYRNALNSGGTGNVFNFTTTNAFSFDVLSESGVSSLPSGTNLAVVYNLGQGMIGADAYSQLNLRSISSVSGSAPTMTINLASGPIYQFASPGKRFHVIPNYSVIFSCTGGATGKIVRSTQAISPTLAACPSSGTTLVDNVDCTNSSFNYNSGAMLHSGLLGATIRLTRSGESVQIFDEVHVNNVP
jgi:MSHA biogenesis protein MshO